MKKKFMIDIETTGVDPKVDEILQIAILEVNFDGNLWIPGKSLDFFQHTDKEPTSEFAREHMKWLYDFCKFVPQTPVAEVRDRILTFFRDCGAKPPQEVFLAGQNSPSFDIPFLVRDGYLQRNRYETLHGKDVMVGDFHYRQFDLSSAIEFVMDQTGLDRSAVFKRAEELGTPKNEGVKHNALADCYSQTQVWNGLLRLSRGEK